MRVNEVPSNVSFLIITFNEEKNIKNCLDSIKWSDDIAILDSCSTDSTISICETYEQVSIYYRNFDNYANQRNWLIDNHNWKNDWVFVIDADEYVDDIFQKELFYLLNSLNKDVEAFAIRRKNYFLGKYLKYCGYSDFYITRIFKKGCGRFTLSVNERLEVNGQIQNISSYLYHDNVKGISDYIEKHNKYSSMEADVFLEKINNSKVETFSLIFSKDPLAKEKFLKNFIIKMPFKGFITFFYLFFWKKGFLDKFEGFYYCLIKSFYFFLIEIKMFEKNKLGSKGR